MKNGWRRRWGAVFLAAWLPLPLSLAADLADLSGSPLKVGVGRVVITPPGAVWLAGYAARTAPSDGVVHDLWAKAIAFEDTTGARTVLVTTDLLGLPASLSLAVAQAAEERFRLPRERLALTFSHTHSAPVLVGDRLEDMYGLEGAERERVVAYTEALPGHLLTAIGAALDRLEPASLTWGQGHCTVAVNRRQYTAQGVTGGQNPIGPVDHSVPVLRAARADGTTLAVVHGYACHCTTLSLQKVCGDYAGFSQVRIEERLPGATALFVAGCGADANPQPRGTLALAERHGHDLAEAVLSVLNGPMTDITGPIKAAYREIPLAFQAPPTREEIERQLAEGNVYHQRRARRLLAVLDRGEVLPATYPYPVQYWQFGDRLRVPILAGEVVVDYALRLKHRYGRDRTWVIGYANDFVAYIPSLRILREGGYEGGDSMVYFGHHGPWAPTVEEDILDAITAMAGPPLVPDQRR